MATIKTSIQMFNGMTPGLRSMTNALNIAISSFETMQRVSSNSIDVSSLQTARIELNRAEVAFSQVEESIRDADQQQKKLNNSISHGTGLAGSFRSALAGIGGMLGVKTIVGISDEFSRSTARLGLMSGSLENVSGLQNQIFQSAQRTRTSYLDTMDAVAKLGLRAGAAFKNSNETIAFVEQLNKQFKIAGASQQEISSATLQLTQALGSGVLRGEEFNAVFEAAPNVMQAIADYMDVPIGKMRDLASDGEISAGIVKNAMFAMAGETEERFREIPHTWSDVWVMSVNKIIESTQPLLNIISVLANHWGTLEPIVLGLAVAFGVFTVATWLATGAAKVFFVTLLSNPLTWLALAIGDVVALMYSWIKSVGGLRNALTILKNHALNIWDTIKINTMAFGNAIQDFFQDSSAGILKTLEDMANGAIHIINALIEELNTIPGVSIETIQEVTFGTEAQTKAEAARQARAAELTDASQLAFLQRTLRLTENSRLQRDASSETANSFNNIYGNVDQIAGNTEKMANSMEISQEELKYLRDMAEREAINRFTTAEIKVDFKNESTINSNLDIDGVVDKFTEKLREAVDISAEEVHVIV